MKLENANQDAPSDSATPPEHTNRLIHETSPYLLQHAHNPVDWHPWGEEAFAKARAENKLIFLSVGYSTCYWCHVMERESFENEEIAKLMNELFINIKVDREERPDVDDIYMAATQLITKGGGWPMSVWLVPDTLKPIHAGTYFPDEPRQGMISFPELCRRVADAWTTQETGLRDYSEQVAQAVQQNLQAPGIVYPLSLDQVNLAFARLMEIYDQVEGGFGSAPKFPQPVFLELLLAVRERLADDSRAIVDAAVHHTLDRMAIGGMYDQVGGGFHRYSTDARWLVPHFEKMLYDNAQLMSVYARASVLYNDAFFAEIVDEIFQYLTREMTDSNGAFYSAQDAEVNAREGLNYLWTVEEVRDALGSAADQELVDFALNVYGLEGGSNFRDPHHPEDGPKNVLFLADRPDSIAMGMGISTEEFNARIDQVNTALLAIRNTREQPRLDDKILTGWNGLMIAGLADAGRALEREDFLDAARSAARFILTNCRADDGGLLRTYRGERGNVPGFLEDYAMLIQGLVALHRATSDASWMEEAVSLASEARDRFHDGVHGGYFDTLPDQSDLFVRTRAAYDGAVPCGNSVMLRNLLDLYELTGEDQYLDDASQALSGLSGSIAQNPVATAISTIALNTIATRYPSQLPRGTEVASDARGAVRVSVDRQSTTVSTDRPGRILLTLDISPGFHINAHEPGDDTLVGLLIDLVDGEGLIISAGYPEGEPYMDSIRVLTGTIIIPVELEQIGDVTGTPRLSIRWQTCTDAECLQPETHVLDVEIDAENSG